MKFISALIYRFLQLLVGFSFRIYFRKIIFINRERLSEKGPLLIASNHPNTLMDPLMVLYSMPQICNILANYSLFKKPISNFILSNLYCIPIQRISDVPDGQPLKNEDAFKRCDEHLMKQGNIYIAVEGTSYPERHIRELKTGMARIAFSVESKTNFDINLRILPVVLTYFEPLKFRQDVIVEIGEPVSVDSWREAYTSNARKAISDFTDSIESVMRNMTIHCKNSEEDEFLKKLEILLQNDMPLAALEHYHRSKRLLNALHIWESEDNAVFQDWTSKVRAYFTYLKNASIEDINTTVFKKELPLSIVTLLALFPVFLIGFINNIVPAWLSNQMVKWLKIDRAYDTTIRYTAGLIFFPIFWKLQFACINDFYGLHALLYILICLITGLVAYWYSDRIKKVRAYLTIQYSKNREEIKHLRNTIMEQLMPLLR